MHNMEDLFRVVKSYDDDGVLLVTDYKVYIVANEILRTLRLLQDFKTPSNQRTFVFLVKEQFGLDLENNHLHKIMWENWINFIADIGLIEIGTRWGNGTHQIVATDADIKNLQYIIDNEMC
jgi:hypothetical protein